MDKFAHGYTGCLAFDGEARILARKQVALAKQALQAVWCSAGGEGQSEKSLDIMHVVGTKPDEVVWHFVRACFLVYHPAHMISTEAMRAMRNVCMDVVRLFTDGTITQMPLPCSSEVIVWLQHACKNLLYNMSAEKVIDELQCTEGSRNSALIAISAARCEMYKLVWKQTLSIRTANELSDLFDYAAELIRGA